jgi:hypothetical protein
MEPVKIDQILYCTNCGVELRVIKPCDSTCTCHIICCKEPMRVKEGSEEGTASGSCCG